jgi:glutamine synthetase adenylyltransferase
VESAQKMRERVSDFIPVEEVERQIKLGPGGLRDIEFTVQLLQLVHGRTDESVRVRDTLGAIDALREAGYVSRTDAAIFDHHYRFLRLLEHRIQLSAMRRTHLMPTTEPALRQLARSTNHKSAEELISHWEGVKVEVRSLHQKVFYRPLLSAVARLGDSDLTLSSDQVSDRLRAIGFQDPESALRHIEALTGGLSRRASIQKTLLPVLLQFFLFRARRYRLARTRYRGLLKRRQVPVAIEGPAPERGTPIMTPEGAEAGEMRSSEGGQGLALLRLEWLDKGALAAGEARLTPQPPPWMKLPEEKA